jgi:hypothetical protein
MVFALMFPFLWELLFEEIEKGLALLKHGRDSDISVFAREL